MSHTEILAHIQRILGDLASAKGARIGTIDESTTLLGGALPIDSLDLAALVVELEQITGRDPFQAGFTDFRTAESSPDSTLNEHRRGVCACGSGATVSFFRTTARH